MWDWNHLKGEGWLRHSMRAAQLAGLLLLSGAAMILHILLPFWQQPKFLRIEQLAGTLRSRMTAPQEGAAAADEIELNTDPAPGECARCAEADAAAIRGALQREERRAQRAQRRKKAAEEKK